MEAPGSTVLLTHGEHCSPEDWQDNMYLTCLGIWVGTQTRPPRWCPRRWATPWWPADTAGWWSRTCTPAATCTRCPIRKRQNGVVPHSPDNCGHCGSPVSDEHEPLPLIVPVIHSAETNMRKALDHVFHHFCHVVVSIWSLTPRAARHSAPPHPRRTEPRSWCHSQPARWYLAGITHHRGEAACSPREQLCCIKTHPEDEVVLHFGLDGWVVHVERCQLLQRWEAGSVREAPCGLRRREGDLDPLHGFGGVEDGSAGALRLHRVIQLKHDEADAGGRWTLLDETRAFLSRRHLHGVLVVGAVRKWEPAPPPPLPLTPSS